MGDRSYTAITVYACPEEHRDAVLDAILETFGQSRDRDETLTLGHEYSVDELVLGEDDTLAGKLQEISGDVVFDCQQEPKYEYPGNRNIQVPELGRTSFSCTSDGDPIVVWQEVQKALTELPAQGTDVAIANRLAGLFQRPHIDRVDTYHREAVAASRNPE